MTNSCMFLEVFVVNDCKGCVAAVTACTQHRTNDTYVSEMPRRTVHSKEFGKTPKSIFLDFQQQIGSFPGSMPGYVVAQGVGGGPVAIPMQASGVTGHTQSFYGYPQAGQTSIGGPVPFQAVASQPQHVVATSSGGGFPPQYTEKSLPEQM